MRETGAHGVVYLDYDDKFGMWFCLPDSVPASAEGLLNDVLRKIKNPDKFIFRIPLRSNNYGFICRLYEMASAGMIAGVETACPAAQAVMEHLGKPISFSWLLGYLEALGDFSGRIGGWKKVGALEFKAISAAFACENGDDDKALRIFRTHPGWKYWTFPYIRDEKKLVQALCSLVDPTVARAGNFAAAWIVGFASLRNFLLGTPKDENMEDCDLLSKTIKESLKSGRTEMLLGSTVLGDIRSALTSALGFDQMSEDEIADLAGDPRGYFHRVFLYSSDKSDSVRLYWDYVFETWSTLVETHPEAKFLPREFFKSLQGGPDEEVVEAFEAHVASA